MYVRDLKVRLRALRAPKYGDKGALWARLVKTAEQRRTDVVMAKGMEARRRLAEEESPMLVARGPPGPKEPSSEERESQCLMRASGAVVLAWSLTREFAGSRALPGQVEEVRCRLAACVSCFNVHEARMFDRRRPGVRLGDDIGRHGREHDHVLGCGRGLDAHKL